ncbi:MAG TPA: EF-hand domain-containing protein [Rhodocyclaceae bacterium]|nr:EF-hand domain-containing protein [Rhodocyclaceae bacterium]
MSMSIGSSTASSIASQLFSQLDTKGQGYIDQSDLQTAVDQLSTANASATSGSSTASVDDVFKQMDTNGDGKVTEQEMADSLQKLSDQLQSHHHHRHMHAAQGGDSGELTKDQLTGIANQASSADSTRAASLTNLINNFDQADTNHDGKISAQEAMSFAQSNSSTAANSTSTSASADSSSSSNNPSSEANVMRQIMELVRAYGNSAQDTTSSTAAAANSISVTA